MASVLGIEEAYKIYQHFKGQQITFPVKWLSKEFVAKEASEKYDGKNLKQLAKEFEYSERWLRQIIKKHSVAEER